MTVFIKQKIDQFYILLPIQNTQVCIRSQKVQFTYFKFKAKLLSCQFKKINLLFYFYIIQVTVFFFTKIELFRI